MKNLEIILLQFLKNLFHQFFQSILKLFDCIIIKNIILLIKNLIFNKFYLLLLMNHLSKEVFYFKINLNFERFKKIKLFLLIYQSVFLILLYIILYFHYHFQNFIKNHFQNISKLINSYEEKFNVFEVFNHFNYQSFNLKFS